MDKKQLEAFGKALELMQKQDKDLYKQLLVLQETIQGLKVELKRERDECEEAFRDLQEISSQSNGQTENKQNTSTKPKEQQTEETLKDKKANETESNIEEKSWKHDRQDSGISVKNCDVEPSGAEPIRNSEAMKTSVPSLKPPVIRHSKQDSGILSDGDTESETKLLSRLMQSSKAFLKSDNRTLQSVHNRLRQVVQNGTLNPQKLGHNRSRSSSDLNKSLMRPFNKDPNPPRLIPKHSHSRSCPSTSIKRFNPESCDYKVVPSHHVRPTQRSASVVNLDTLDKKERNVNENWHSSENGIRSNVMAKSVPNLAVGNGEEKAQPLRAVLVSACEVSGVSNASGRRVKVSRQTSLDTARMTDGARGTELMKGPQRRFTVLGVKPESRAFYDSKHLKPFNTGAMNERDSGYSSPSFQFPRNHVRHSTMPENNEKRRRHSLRILHSSSKSWDGYVERAAREFPNLSRSSSQVSLV